MNYSGISKRTLHFLCIVSLVTVAGCFIGKEAHVFKTNRTSAYPILDIILNRYSPRAMSGESLSHDELMTILEAGRWAPSSYNDQPWHFIYGVRDTPFWHTLFDLLVPFNQSWVAQGSVLVCVISEKYFFETGKPSRTHLFDAGAAWENMALQATSMGLVCHGMEGFDYERARAELQIPESYDIAMMFVVGKPAPASTLPPALASKETPSDRVPLEDIISEGVFKPKRVIKQ